MKKLLVVLTTIILVACGQKKAVTENKEPQKDTSISKHVDVRLSPVTEVTKDNAKSIISFENTPESVVMYFYASRIRKDNKWEEVCIPQDQRSGKLTRGLEEYNNWDFTKYRFVEKKEFEKGKYWVKIYMSIIVEGETDDGEDEVTVEMIDGKWMITEVPT